jgi:CTP:molybdopterin cytidylyltransferase MocA
VEVLLDGGCAEVVLVLGCEAAAARSLLPDVLRSDTRLLVREATDWAGGMSRSLRVGLAGAAETAPVAALVHLVDLPDVGVDVLRRLLSEAGIGRAVLARAAYAGVPGHPVLIGADHLGPLLAELGGLGGPGELGHSTADAGARSYLKQHHVVAVECSDLATGQDRDGVG